MQVIRHSREYPDILKHAVVALGNFDGVHQGHQAVIAMACSLAKEKRVPSAVMTFEPHPASVLRPGAAFRIENFRAKAVRIQELGVDVLCVEHFSPAFASLSAEAFVAEILVGRLAVSHVVIGRDFIFGHNRSGDAEILRQLAKRYNLEFTQVRPILAEERSCSSSAIRQAIAKGDMQRAAVMLGRPYSIEGRVVHGEKRGRMIDIPTANLTLRPELLHPAYGVYAARALLEGQWHDAVVNIGVRPTFDPAQPILEAHLLEHNADIYGKRIRVALLEYLRPEQRFSGVEALKQQVSIDITKAKKVLREKKELI